jgi:Ser/Thr protein kinase RdoA (MazF antagonist)
LNNVHLVHGDYTNQNVFFDEQGRVAYVFDFEKAVYQHRSQELFRSLYLIFIDGNNEHQEMKDAKKYLDTYLSVSPMSYEELSAGFDMHYQKMIYGIWVESEHYLKENSKIDSLLKRDHVRLHFIAKNNDMFKEFLLRDLS